LLDVNSRGFAATFLALPDGTADPPAHIALEDRNPAEKKVGAREF